MMDRISAAHCSAPAPDTSVMPWSFFTWILTWYWSCILMMFCPPRPMMRPSWPAVWSVMGAGPSTAPGASATGAAGAAPSAGGASKPDVRWRCAGFSNASGGSMSSPSRSRLTPRSSSPPDMAAALSAMACALAFIASKSIAAGAAGSGSAGGAAASGSGSGSAAASGSGSGSA